MDEYSDQNKALIIDILNKKINYFGADDPFNTINEYVRNQIFVKELKEIKNFIEKLK